MKKRIVAWMAAAALVVSGLGVSGLLADPAEARNPHCAGASDNFKHPTGGVNQNHPGCE